MPRISVTCSSRHLSKNASIVVRHASGVGGYLFTFAFPLAVLVVVLVGLRLPFAADLETLFPVPAVFVFVFVLVVIATFAHLAWERDLFVGVGDGASVALGGGAG